MSEAPRADAESLLARAREERGAWRSGCTQGLADLDGVRIAAVGAHALDSSAEDSVRVLDKVMFVRAERGTERGQRLGGLAVWQEPGELRRS